MRGLLLDLPLGQRGRRSLPSTWRFPSTSGVLSATFLLHWILVDAPAG